jgi:hypothetical protein
MYRRKGGEEQTTITRKEIHSSPRTCTRMVTVHIAKGRAMTAARSPPFHSIPKSTVVSNKYGSLSIESNLKIYWKVMIDLKLTSKSSQAIGGQ